MAFLILITSQFSCRRNARVMSRALNYLKFRRALWTGNLRNVSVRMSLTNETPQKILRKGRGTIANEFFSLCASNYKLPSAIAKWFKNLMSNARFTLGSEFRAMEVDTVRCAAGHGSQIGKWPAVRNFSKDWKLKNVLSSKKSFKRLSMPWFQKELSKTCKPSVIAWFHGARETGTTGFLRTLYMGYTESVLRHPSEGGHHG